MKKIIRIKESDIIKMVEKILKNNEDEIIDEEFIVEDEEGGEEKSSSKSTSTVKKWQGQRGWENVTRGKANPISFKSVWQSGISRGPANPL